MADNDNVPAGYWEWLMAEIAKLPKLNEDDDLDIPSIF